MPQLEPLNLKITGTSAGLSAALGKAQTDINGFASKVDQQSQSITQRLSNIGASIGAIALPAGITAGLGFGLKLAGEAEQAKVAFEVLLGSGEAANKMLANLQKFAATTPFQFPEIRQSAQLLTAFGFSAEDVQQQLKVLGNIAAGTGQPITELAELVGKARVQNTIFSEDLNQLTGRGIPVLDLLAQRFGVTNDSVKKLASEGKIQFADLNAVLTALGDGSGRFAGLMEKQSATLLGTFSTLQDNVSAVATEIGTALIPAATAFVNKLSEWIEFVKSFDVSTVEATVKVTAFATSFAAAILIIPRVISLATQLVAAIRAIGVASAITQALSGPKGWATLAAGLAIAAGAVYCVDQLFNGLNETQAKTVAGAEKVAKGQETVAKRAIEAADATKKVKSETDRWTE